MSGREAWIGRDMGRESMTGIPIQGAKEKKCGKKFVEKKQCLDSEEKLVETTSPH
jgi:hypothetical protein